MENKRDVEKAEGLPMKGKQEGERHHGGKPDMGKAVRHLNDAKGLRNEGSTPPARGKMSYVLAFIAALGMATTAAHAAGLWQGYDSSSNSYAAAPLTGNEFAPFDTTLPNGTNPQTEGISVTTLKGYMFANAGVPGAIPNGTASATAGAATLNQGRGVITSEALTTAAGSDYVLTLTDGHILATSVVEVSAANGTNTTEGLAVNRVQPAAGSLVVHIRNTHASAALNGTIKIAFLVVN